MSSVERSKNPGTSPVLAALGLFAAVGLAALPSEAQSSDDLLRRIEALERQNVAQTEELARLREQMKRQPPTGESASPLRARAEAPAGASGKGAPGQARKPDEFRWDFGGQYRVMVNASNSRWHPDTVNDEVAVGFANQRFRTWLSVSPVESVEGYLQVEFGHIPWGSNFEGTKTYAGPRFPGAADPNGDRVGIELRRGYLTYRNEDAGDFRIGIQDWHDQFTSAGSSIPKEPAVDDYRSFGSILANSIWDFNVGGLTWHREFAGLGDLQARAGWYELFRAGGSLRFADAHLTALDLDLPVGEDAGVGLSTYYLYDGGLYSYPTVAAYDRAWDVWLGLRGHAKLGAVPLNAFAIWNVGGRDDPEPLGDFEHSGWAAKIEAGPVTLGPGDLSVQALFSTGEDDPTDRNSSEFRTIAQSERDNFGAQGYWSYLVLTSPHGPSDVNDLGVGVQNRGLGLITLQAKYDYPLFGSLRGTTAAGWLGAQVDRPANDDQNIGFEAAQTFALDLGGGMSTQFGVAWLLTGGFYDDAPPGTAGADDLWEAFTRFQLEF